MAYFLLYIGIFCLAYEGFLHHQRIKHIKKMMKEFDKDIERNLLNATKRFDDVRRSITNQKEQQK